MGKKPEERKKEYNTGLKKHIPLNELRKLPIEERRKVYNTYPGKLFLPAGTEYYEVLPKLCPHDAEPLRRLTVSKYKKKGGKRGWCCLSCFRQFLPKSEQPMMFLEKKSSSIDHSKPAFPTENSKLAETTNNHHTSYTQSAQGNTNHNSVILTATLCKLGAKEATFNVTIVANEHKQDSSKKIYWVGRSFSAAILAAIQTKDKCLFHEGSKYQIVDFVAEKNAEKYLKIISRFSNPLAPQTVYVFSQKNIPQFDQNRFELVTAMIPCADRVYPVPATVYYDKEKKQYFINDATYTDLRKNYGLPYMRLQVATGQVGTQWFTTLKPRSELNLLGYNVSVADGLSSENRRKILRDAINSGVMWKGEIINHLEWLVHTMGKNQQMENAVGEWKSDLMYISKYQATEQRQIWVNKFMSRFSEQNLF